MCTLWWICWSTYRATLGRHIGRYVDGHLTNMTTLNHPQPIYMNRDMSVDISTNILVKCQSHRRTGNFLPGGGAVNHLPKKFLQVTQIFTKQLKRNEGHTMQQHRPYWHLKVARYSVSGSILAKFEHKLCRNKQTFGKIATTVVLDKDENLS